MASSKHHKKQKPASKAVSKMQQKETKTNSKSGKAMANALLAKQLAEAMKLKGKDGKKPSNKDKGQSAKCNGPKHASADPADRLKRVRKEDVKSSKSKEKAGERPQAKSSQSTPARRIPFKSPDSTRSSATTSKYAEGKARAEAALSTNKKLQHALEKAAKQAKQNAEYDANGDLANFLEGLKEEEIEAASKLHKKEIEKARQTMKSQNPAGASKSEDEAENESDKEEEEEVDEGDAESAPEENEDEDHDEDDDGEANSDNEEDGDSEEDEDEDEDENENESSEDEASQPSDDENGDGNGSGNGETGKTNGEDKSENKDEEDQNNDLAKVVSDTREKTQEIQVRNSTLAFLHQAVAFYFLRLFRV